MFIYKPVKSTPLNKKHIAHKSWTITDETSGTYSIVSYSGHYSDGEWNISDTSCNNIALEATTANGYYKREIFDSIYHLYYTDVENTTKSGDPEYLLQQTRDFNSEVHVISIPSNIYGNRLKESTVTMSGATANLYDDGVGNLRDTFITNSANFKSFSKSDYILKCDFNDGWKSQTTNPSIGLEFKTNSPKLIDISDGPLEPVGTNITFDRFSSGNYGISGSTYMVLHGSHSIASSSNSIVRIENSVILGANERRWDSDFAISLWVNAPVSQSVTSSFNGAWTSDDSASRSERILTDHISNVITTSRESSQQHVPWELEIYNSTSANKGKLRFARGYASALTTITSSAINDANWHHVVLQVATGSMQLWLDGTLQESIKDDPAASFAIYDPETDIHIGALPHGHKTRTRETGLDAGNDPIFVGNAKNFIHPFKGNINQYRAFNRAITSPEITSLFTYKRDSNIVGNVFYNHGIATITDLSGSYDALVNDYTLQFKGTTEHTIHNYQCVVEDEEYNVTFNPSARVDYDKNNPKLKGFATSSNFTPFITTIGLYDHVGELLAVSKLANPIQSPKDLDIVFNVQFDT